MGFPAEIPGDVGIGGIFLSLWPSLHENTKHASIEFATQLSEQISILYWTVS